MSLRIHQIAKQIGMENKELLALLKERGYAVKSVASSIDNITAESLIQELGPASAEEEATASDEAAPAEPEAEGPAEAPAGGGGAPPPPAPEPPKATPERKPAAVDTPAQAPKLATAAQPPPPPPPASRPSAPAGRSSAPARPAAPPPPPPKRGSAGSGAPPPPPPPSPARTGVSAPPRPPSPPRPGARPPAPPRPPGGPDESAPPPAGTEPSGEDASPDGEPGSAEAAPAGAPLVAKPPLIVRDFATLLGLKPFQLLSDLMDRGIFASMNQTIEEEVAVQVAASHGFALEVRHRGEGETAAGAGSRKKKEVLEEVPPEPRSPVVCILGHVDHGKTTLLDTIRKAKVAAGEHGGMTQHIGAYRIGEESQKISFLDTPGHAAFAGIRERGAGTTDIAVLVVAADDGFMPQTDEALRFAQKAQNAVIVAINKIDAPGANPDRVRQQMQERGIPPEEWGGETIAVPLSALKGEGIDQLLEMIRLQAEIMELKAPFKGKSSGVILESTIEQGRGPTATVLVQKGTLKVGDALVCDTCTCKARALYNDNGQSVKQAVPSEPVRVIGWSDAPPSGATFHTVKNERAARQEVEELLEEREREQEAAREAASAAGGGAPTVEDLFSAIESTRKQSYPVILKADTNGSLEAVEHTLGEIPTDRIDLQILSRQVGPVTKRDIDLAATSGATVLAFNVKLENGVQGHAKHHGVSILQQSIIYEFLDLVRDAMADLLEPEVREQKLGVAEVRAVFPVGRTFVAGCMVTEGRLRRDAKARLFRSGELLHESRLATLKRFKDDATEVRAGYECGVSLAGFKDYREGDQIECVETETLRPSL